MAEIIYRARWQDAPPSEIADLMQYLFEKTWNKYRLSAGYTFYVRRANQYEAIVGIDIHDGRKILYQFAYDVGLKCYIFHVTTHIRTTCICSSPRALASAAVELGLICQWHGGPGGLGRGPEGRSGPAAGRSCALCRRARPRCCHPRPLQKCWHASPFPHRD